MDIALEKYIVLFFEVYKRVVKLEGTVSDRVFQKYKAVITSHAGRA